MLNNREEAGPLIKRELYMRRIRPFMANELVKVLTGIRRSGKTVMLDLIKDELIQSGADETRFLSYNFESMRNAPLCTAEALYQNILEKVGESEGKIYLFFDEIQEVENWEKCQFSPCRYGLRHLHHRI